VRSVTEAYIIVDIDNNGYLNDLQYMALKLIEGKDKFNTVGQKILHIYIYIYIYIYCYARE